MIVKGKPRSGPAQLAAYLLRSDEHAILIELFDGGEDLHKAFLQWHAIGEATRGDKTLYHAQMAPEAEYKMTPAQWKRAAEILAEELGMKDHPRAIVVHDGGDKPHAHVVFQRAQADTLTMWDDSYNYVKHERASQRMELEFGHKPVPGKHVKRDRKKQPEFPRQKLTQDEAQYEKRTGLKAEDRKAQITALHAAADSGAAFKAALEDAGYVLAQGERGYIVVDQAGGHSALSRNINGLKKKELDAFMAGVALDKLPTIEEAKALQAERPVKAEKQGPEASKFLRTEQAPAALQPSQAPEDPEITALKKALAERQAKEAGKWAEFHAQELRQLEVSLDKRNGDKLAQRDADDLQAVQALKDDIRERHTGLKGLIDTVKSKLKPRLAAEQAKQRRHEIAALKRRQKKERSDYAVVLEKTRQLEIDNLKERQELKRRDIEREHREETERYLKEHEDAKRILAEAKEEERRQELEHNDTLRDGPPPPKLGK
jgi:hypothetical protein